MAKRQQVLERNQDKTIGLILDGLSDAEVAGALSNKQVTVSRQGVTAFRHRHAAEIAAAKERQLDAVVEIAIADKQERLKALNNRWSLGHQVILARANDPDFASTPGYSTGLLTRDVKAVGDDLVDVFKVDTALLAELRAMERAAAEELGQLPRPNPSVPLDGFSRVLYRELIIERGARLEPLG